MLHTNINKRIKNVFTTFIIVASILSSLSVLTLISFKIGQSITAGATPVCPSGYTVNGSQCIQRVAKVSGTAYTCDSPAVLNTTNCVYNYSGIYLIDINSNCPIIPTGFYSLNLSISPTNCKLLVIPNSYQGMIAVNTTTPCPSLPTNFYSLIFLASPVSQCKSLRIPNIYPGITIFNNVANVCPPPPTNFYYVQIDGTPCKALKIPTNYTVPAFESPTLLCPATYTDDGTASATPCFKTIAPLSFTCPAGQYLTNTSTDSCTACPAGKFCVGGVSAVATQCPVNTYCLTSASSATSCPANTTSVAGSTSAAACVNNVPPNLSLKVNLAGSFDNNTDLMSTVLDSQSILPLSQPFNVAPWNYTGTETIPNVGNSTTCDWVLIEVRDGVTNALVTRKASTLENSGLRGGSISLPGVTTTGNYKIIVRSRNHIAIATNTPVQLTLGGTTNIDFTSNVNVKSNNQIQVGTVGTGNTGSAIYGLRLSDSNSDGSIDALDRSFISSSPEFDGVYDTKDVNLDGAVDAFDRSLSQNALEASEVL